MENTENIEELIAGYALGMLDETEQAQAEQLLATNSAAQALLAELNEVTASLALSVAPVELPGGSLERLRQKAGVEAKTPSTATADPTPATKPTPVPTAEPVATSAAPAPLEFKPRPRTRFVTGFSLGWAAAIVLFITTVVFASLWISGQQKPGLSDNERNAQALTQLLSSPTLKVTDLKPTGSNNNGTLRLYTDSATNKAYLVTQNLTSLPSDKEYEAWIIAADNQPYKAGLLGPGSNGTVVYALNPPQPVDQYKVVAITVENKGGADKPTQQPILAGTV